MQGGRVLFEDYDQRLYLIPERDMVVVRQADGILGAMRGGGSGWSDPDFLAFMLS